MFGTTPSFLRYFGLQDLSGLPDPDEFTRRHGGSEEENSGSEKITGEEGEQGGF